MSIWRLPDGTLTGFDGAMKAKGSEIVMIDHDNSQSKIDNLRSALAVGGLPGGWKDVDLILDAAHAFLVLLDSMPRPSPKDIDPDCEFSKGWDHCLSEVKVLISSEWWT